MSTSMKKEYDFEGARLNPYAKRLKRAVTIRMEAGTILYFKKLSRATGMPYQTLINLYLQDCAASRRRPRMQWLKASRRPSATRGRTTGS